MTSPTTLPPGHEIISPDIARLKPNGMKVWSTFDRRWTLFSGCGLEGATHDFYSDCSLYLSAATGTLAALYTPLPEARCVGCVRSPGGDEHRLFCPAHPRNRLVRVLPGQLKDLPKQPEGLLWAARGTGKWISCEHAWWKMRESFLDDPIFAYALPQWSYDAAMGRGEDRPWSSSSIHDEMAKLPESMLCGEQGLSTQPESEVKICASATNDGASPILIAPDTGKSISESMNSEEVSNAAPETSEPFRAAATPSAEEMLDWLEDPKKCYWVMIQRQPDGERIHDSDGPGIRRAIAREIKNSKK